MPQFRKTPDIVKALGERVESWSEDKQYLKVLLKDVHFGPLYIRNIPISFDFDKTKWMFARELEIVPPERMGKREDFYRMFKSLQSEVAWRRTGFLRKQPYFRPLPASSTMGKNAEGEKHSNRLAEALNGNGELLTHIRKTNIDALSVTLSKYPNSITFIIQLTAALVRSFDYVSRVNGIYDILNLTSRTVSEVSTNVYRDLSD